MIISLADRESQLLLTLMQARNLVGYTPFMSAVTLKVRVELLLYNDTPSPPSVTPSPPPSPSSQSDSAALDLAVQLSSEDTQCLSFILFPAILMTALSLSCPLFLHLDRTGTHLPGHNIIRVSYLVTERCSLLLH